MKLRFWAATDTGRVRDHNEDNFLVDQNLQLFVVCDGMGGHAAGEVASAVCVRTVREVIDADKEVLTRLKDNPTDQVAVEKLKQLLRRAVLTACRRIFEMAQQDPSRRGMGTTCVALVLVGNRGFVGHVGDSRMYRIRHGEIDQITDDHSLLNEMIRQGKVPSDTSEATFPHKNAVTRAVGVRETVEVDAFGFVVEPGDRLLMCSDGLSEYFDESVNLLDLMGGAEPEETTTRCIDFANESGGKDNITVVVVDCGPQIAREENTGPDRAEVIEILRTTPYFHYLAPPELERIRQMATRHEVEAGEDVVADDEDDDRLYLILKGSVSLQLDGEQVSVLTTGEHFGEMALIDAQDEKDTNLVARTVEPSIFLTVERDQFVGLLRGESGLAIKLLWNFVQVFADRLQSVPPEYRYTPDEWRSDPEAIADVTPPSGTLVFEEDLERMEKGKAEEEMSKPRGGSTLEGPPELPGDSSVAGPGVASSASSRETVNVAPTQGAESTDEPEVDPRATMKLETVNRKGMDTIPPGVDEANGVEGVTGDDGEDTPQVEFNPPTARRERSDPSTPTGLSSGTYDQSILETGVGDQTGGGDGGGEAEEAHEKSAAEDPTVSFNRPRPAPEGEDGATVTSGAADATPTPGREDADSPPDASREELKKTMKIDWAVERDDAPPALDAEDASSEPPESPPELPGEQPPELPDDGEDPARERSTHARERPRPSAEILKKASRNGVSPSDGGRGGVSADGNDRETDDKMSKTTGDAERAAAVSGRTEVDFEDDDDSPEPEEPKVMIASDLMADVEENS